MKLHARVMLVQKAHNELSSFVLDWAEKHDLTYGEVIMGLAQQQCTLAKLMIREERHPGEPDARGGLA